MDSTNSLVTFLYLYSLEVTVNHEKLKVFAKGIEEHPLCAAIIQE